MNENTLSSISRTNWAALETMSDEDLDYSDIPPLSDDFFENATLCIPVDEAKNLVLLDVYIKTWLALWKFLW